MVNQPLIEQGAFELAHRIAEGEVTSQEVVGEHIRFASAVNPKLNAIVASRFDAAMQEAKEADRLRDGVKSPKELPPLHGVPCTIKECFGVSGMPQTAGLVERKGELATADAAVVERLRNAGAIVLGVTNTSELCMWMESANYVYGRTSNPYDARHIVGGSSGGEGAIVGSGASPFGVGSDIGGSIRMPAFFNGVFGHKPTPGRVPNRGQYPRPGEGASGYLTTGPLCRRAEDLWPLLRLMSGPHPEDPETQGPHPEDPETQGPHPEDPETQGPERGPVWPAEPPSDFTGLKAYSIADNGRVGVSKELQAAQAACAEPLRAAGFEVQSLALPGLKKSLEMWSVALTAAGGDHFAHLLSPQRPLRPLWQLFKATRGQSLYTLPALALALVEAFPALSGPAAEELLAAMAQLKEEICELLAGGSIALFPSFPRVAPVHQLPLALPWEFQYTAIWNVLELPVTQVPLGLNEQGLPLGVQVVGAPGHDAHCVATALLLEKRFGGWRLPRSCARLAAR